MSRPTPAPGLSCRAPVGLPAAVPASFASQLRLTHKSPKFLLFRFVLWRSKNARKIEFVTVPLGWWLVGRRDKRVSLRSSPQSGAGRTAGGHLRTCLVVLSNVNALANECFSRLPCLLAFLPAEVVTCHVLPRPVFLVEMYFQGR